MKKITNKSWEEMFENKHEKSGCVAHGEGQECCCDIWVKSFISQTLDTAEAGLKERLVDGIVKERRIYSERPYLWPAESKTSYDLEDFDGSFEKQKIIGYNAALSDIITLINSTK